jgi:hypothetical protein
MVACGDSTALRVVAGRAIAENEDAATEAARRKRIGAFTAAWYRVFDKEPVTAYIRHSLD